jgi:serine/threonine protein kinase
MGAGISEHYDSINPIFTSGFWKVHSATHKLTQVPVSLWLFDQQLLKTSVKSSAERLKYTDAVNKSVAQLRRIRHPNILKITEISENPKDIGFAAEQVDNTLEGDTTLTVDDVTYVANQLAHALQFLHDSAGIVCLSINPSTVCLTTSLEVKICDFTFAEPWWRPYHVSPIHPRLNYSAPELLFDGDATAASDVFSWAAVIASSVNKKPLFDAMTIELYMQQLKERAMPEIASEDMRDIVIQGLKVDASLRPSVEEIIKSKGFLQLSIRSLRFIDMILTKTDADRFSFYANMVGALSLFSDRLLRYKMQPLFMTELRRDIRYGPAVIPLIFHIGCRFSQEDFMREIIVPLKPILQMTEPENLALANLSVTPIIVDRVEVDQHFDVLYPLFVSSLQSQSPRLRAEAVKRVPLVVAGTGERQILSSLLPTLLTFIDEIQDLSIVCSVVDCLAESLVKVNHDNFCELVFPKLVLCWCRVRCPGLASAIESLLARLKPSPPKVCKFVLPMASEVLSSRLAKATTETKLAAIIHAAVDTIVTDRHLIERTDGWSPMRRPEAEIVPPIRVSIDLATHSRVSAPSPGPLHKSSASTANVFALTEKRTGTTPIARRNSSSDSYSTTTDDQAPVPAAPPSMFAGMSLGGGKKKHAAASSFF